MSPDNVLNDTLEGLRGTRRDMSRAIWLLAMKRQPESVRHEAALARLDVEQAILALGNATLSDIRQQLISNEHELRDGMRNLRDARQSLNQVKTVLGKIASVLDTVGKIVNFLRN